MALALAEASHAALVVAWHEPPWLRAASSGTSRRTLYAAFSGFGGAKSTVLRRKPSRPATSSRPSRCRANVVASLSLELSVVAALSLESSTGRDVAVVGSIPGGSAVAVLTQRLSCCPHSDTNRMQTRWQSCLCNAQCSTWQALLQ